LVLKKRVRTKHEPIVRHFFLEPEPNFNFKSPHH
jgi:hypothetical protein